VTGIASDGSYTYVLGNDYSGEPTVEYFNSSGSVQTYPYMEDLPALSSHYDIAMEGGSDGDGDIWVANDGADSPIKAYDTSDQLVAWVPGDDLPAGAEIRGLTFDPDGYLWASDDDADKIYQIDITSGTAEGASSTVGGAALRVSDNPFSGSVTITLAGAAGPAELAVYDMTGRTVMRRSLASASSVTWSGRGVPSGTYLVRATTADGRVMSRLVTRL
jgi:WD40 repeat protein